MEFKPVVFFIGEEQYGVDINVVRGIEKPLPIVPMPNANEIIKGIINLRGEIVPICSLRRKFGLPEKDIDGNSKFIIVKTDSINIGLLVDSVGDIQDVDESHIFEVPKIVRNKDTDYYSKIINKDGTLIIILDINQLMSDSQMKELESAISDMKA